VEKNNTGDKTRAENGWWAYQPLRAAAVSIALVVFLFAFRPFGLTLSSVEDALVLLGLAPLNFLIISVIHALPIREGRWRAAAAFGCLVIGNTAYVAAWSQNSRALDTGLSVTLVVALTASIIFLWNRGQVPVQEFDRPDTDDGLVGAPFTLSGESDQEILRLTSNELLFMRANGNYVVVHYLRDHVSATSMLRSSLAGLAAQVPGGQVVQCHRSHFVNLAVARRIVRSKGRTLIEFDGGQHVPVSRTFRQDVVKAISA
jgi:DNA-binding LytR/AlgR family response regulator